MKAVRELRTEVDLDTVLTQLDGTPVMQDQDVSVLISRLSGDLKEAMVALAGVVDANAEDNGEGDTVDNFNKAMEIATKTREKLEASSKASTAKPFTLRTALLVAVSSFKQDEQLSIPEKLHIARLAKRVFGATAPVVFNVEDTALLKNLVNKVFPNALLVEQVLVLLDPSLAEKWA